mmetsp:Transcript_43171/g.99502  ORF Transcript_43171/g.99502 Transcript_43171/m.99502 type:complete len:1172 (+) Transcript_43171:84-3599(+)
MRAKKAEEAFLERYRCRSDRTLQPAKQALSELNPSRSRLAPWTRSTVHGQVSSPRSSDNHEASHGLLHQAHKAGLDSRSTSVHSRVPCSRLDSLAHLRLAWERISTEELLDLSAEVNDVIDAEMERFLCRPSFELEVKVVALICAMGLADETVSVAGVLDDELPLSAWISAQRMLQAPADLLDALGSFPPHSARCSQDAPWPGQALQAARVFLAQDADEVCHCVLSHLQLWIQAAVLHFDPSMTTYVDDPSTLDDREEDSVELVHRPSLLSIDDTNHSNFGAATPMQEARPSDQCEEQAEVAALFREVGNEVQHREDIFRSKLPALEEMGRALNTSLFGEAKPEVQDEKESGHQDVTELVTEVAAAASEQQAPLHMESFQELLRRRVSQVLGKRPDSEVAIETASDWTRSGVEGALTAAATGKMHTLSDAPRAPRVLVHDVDAPSVQLQDDPNALRVIVHEEESPLRGEQRECPGTTSSHNSSRSDEATQDEYTNPVTFSGDIAQLQRWQRLEQNDVTSSNSDIACDPEAATSNQAAKDDEITQAWQRNALKEANRIRDESADVKTCKENLPPKKEEVARKLSLGTTAGMDAGRQGKHKQLQEPQKMSSRCASTPLAGIAILPSHGSHQLGTCTQKRDAIAAPTSSIDGGCSPTMQLQFDDSADLDMLCKALERAAASSQPAGAGNAKLLRRHSAQQDTGLESADAKLVHRQPWKAAAHSASVTPPSRSWPYVSPVASQACLSAPSPWPAPALTGNDLSTSTATAVSRGVSEPLQKSAPCQRTPCSIVPPRPASVEARTPPSSLSMAVLSDTEGILARLRALQSTQRTPPQTRREAAHTRTPRTWTRSPAPPDDDVKGILTRLHAVSAAPLQPTPRTTPRVHRRSEPPSSAEHRGISVEAPYHAREHRWNRVSIAASPPVSAGLLELGTEDSMRVRRASDLSGFQRLHDAAEKVKRPHIEELPRDDARGGMAMLLQSVQTVNQMQHRRQSTSCLANDTPRGIRTESFHARQVSGSPWRRSTPRAPLVVPEAKAVSDAISDVPMPHPARVQIAHEEPQSMQHADQEQAHHEAPKVHPESSLARCGRSLSQAEQRCAERVASASKKLCSVAELYGTRIGMCFALVLLIILCMWCAMWLAKVTIGAIAWRVGEPPLEHVHQMALHNPDQLQGYF